MGIDEKAIKKIDRFYLFYGPNAYMLRKRVSALINAVIPAGAEAFDLDRYDGRRCEMAEVLNSLSTPPVMSPLRVIFLESVEKISSKSQGLLCDTLPRIPEYSVLAMTAEKADKRSKLFKTILATKKKIAFFYNEFTQPEASDMVLRLAAEKGKKLAPHLADAIVGLYGTEPYRLENELEKLSLLIGKRPEIEKKDLAFSTGYSKVETAYDLPELIFDGNIKEALELSARAMISGISEMQILYILKNHIERLNAACNLSQAKELMSTYRMPYAAAAKLFAQSKKIKPSAILVCASLIFKAEYALKSARFPSGTIVELLVVAVYLASGGNKKRL